VKFKHYMTSDKADFLRSRPAYPMYYDTDFTYMKDRDFWFKLLMGFAVGSYAYNKIWVERDRARRTARMNGYKDLPAHWFHNRGGVIVMKQFTGFQKYYKNGDEMMDWYRMVYPDKMGSK
jgi:hypothetical protein